MKTIIVALDFSPTTKPVMVQAAKLAHDLNARVVLVNVVETPVFVADTMTVVNTGDIVAEMEKYAAHQLKKWQSKLGKIPSLTLQLTGCPVSQIVAQVKKYHADYVVIGTHGHTAFYDLLIGSTTSGVVKRALCPVIVVAAPGSKKPR